MRRYGIDRTKHLSEREYQKLHDKLLAMMEHQERMRDVTLIFLSMYTGARPQEILNLRGKDLDHERKTVFIRGLKGSENREIPLAPWLFDRLSDRAESRLKTQKLFDIGYQRYRQVWDELGVSGHTLKSLRHTFAVRYYKSSNHNLQAIQTALGHRSIQNTIVYAKYQMDADQLRKILGV